MEASGDEDTAVLSDVEGDEPSPVALSPDHYQEHTASDRLRETLLELERERQATQAAENAKAELQKAFNRLKTLTQDAIKTRNENGRQREEALREKEEAMKARKSIVLELEEAVRAKQEAVKQREDATRVAEEASIAKDSSRSEIETATQMLISGFERIGTKVSSLKTFPPALPTSIKYSGLPAIAYGVIKRTNDILEELLRQLETAKKNHDRARMQIEQRNIEIAIEVSQLESTISGLREELNKKSSELETLERVASAREARISEMYNETQEKLRLADQDCQELRRNLEEQNTKLGGLESKIESQRPLLFEQLNYLYKSHEQLVHIIRVVDLKERDHEELSEGLFVPRELDVNEHLRSLLSTTASLFELTKMASEKVSLEIQERVHEKKEMEEKISNLVAEKKHIGTLLRSTLKQRISTEELTCDSSGGKVLSRTNVVLKVAENGLRSSGLDIQLDALLENAESLPVDNNIKDDEIFGLAAALENIVRASQLEVMELRKTVEALREESSQLKAFLETQAKEIAQKKLQIKELEEKEQTANENVEGLMIDISAAEEEITRWKVAAEQEAAAGKAVEVENRAKVEALKQELEELKQQMQELENKLTFKEETAAAAMAARDAAAVSLRLTDARATRLRERLEELTRQFEESEGHGESNSRRHRYICWPWQWLGLQYVGSRGDRQQNSNEMELSEPLM